jgi:RNA polymerase sigma factor (sigma-70 family)
MTDEQIMLQVKGGQLDLASLIYDRYNKLIYNYFLRLSFNREISQDLMQTVFFRMIKYRRSYKPKNKFRSWIFRIARNVFADHLKSNEAARSNFVDLEEMNASIDSVMDDQGKAEKIRILQTALTMIPHGHREVLILKGYQQLKNREIAELLNCSENAVKGKVHRAVESLRKAFFTIEKSEL